MKKNFCFFASLAISTLAILPACSDNDNEKKDGLESTSEEVKTITLDATAYDKWVYFKFADQTSVAHAIEPLAGTYTGNVSVTVAGQNQGTAEDLKLEITRVTNDSLTLVLKDFHFTSEAMGPVALGDITSGAKVKVTPDGWQLEGGEIALEGLTVSSTGLIAGSTIDLDIRIQPGAMPIPLAATYKGEMETDANVDETTFDWDIAIHRYDVKTNQGSAQATTEKELSAVTVLPAGGFVADVKTDSLIYDMSGMTNNAVGYATAHINEILTQWVRRDGMPPVFTLSGLVYLVKTKSGEYAKIKFTDYTDDENVNGHITFAYVYPFQ